MKYPGQDTVDGKKCSVYKTTDEGSKAKVWLWEEYGFPIRVESLADGQTVVVEYKNIKVDDIPASMFELPAGVQVMEFQ
ncbi:MAG: hypothetical protein RDV00_00565 [Clostridia bacterium]|nr:hypothetical protein [Clostridia bacterium]MDQ7790608.1 hypothetical protein [Clostridia bacterium]